MTQQRPWPAELTQATGRAIRHYRRERGMSAEQLAEAVSSLGLRYTRTQVTNLESGRRDSITVGEVFALGAALGVPPLLLIFPLGREATVESLPNIRTSPWKALRWTERGLIDRDDLPMVTHTDYRVIEWFRRHEELLGRWVYARNERTLAEKRGYRTGPEELKAELADLDRMETDAVKGLADVRDLIRAAGRMPPELPASLGYLDDEVSEVGSR